MRDKVAGLRVEADRLERLSQRFPDLTEYRGRWRTVLVAKSANAAATGVEVRYSCGCCVDAAVVAWPFVDVDGQRVYSSPTDFKVGTKDDDGDYPWDGWDKPLRDAGIPEQVIEQVAARLTGQRREQPEELVS